MCSEDKKKFGFAKTNASNKCLGVYEHREEVRINGKKVTLPIDCSCSEIRVADADFSEILKCDEKQDSALHWIGHFSDKGTISPNEIPPGAKFVLSTSTADSIPPNYGNKKNDDFFIFQMRNGNYYRSKIKDWLEEFFDLTEEDAEKLIKADSLHDLPNDIQKKYSNFLKVLFVSEELLELECALKVIAEWIVACNQPPVVKELFDIIHPQLANVGKLETAAKNFAVAILSKEATKIKCKAQKLLQLSAQS